MLFSLVLAVASKEIELWQTFDDFAPRRLMEDGEEVEDLEEPEMGDEENLEGEDDMGGDLTEEEEEGLNPLMIAVPAAAAVAVGAYFFMNQGQKEKQEDKPLMDRLTVDGLKNDSEVQIAAGATAAVAGLGLYALLGGAPTAPVSTGFMASTGAMATAGAGALGVVGTLGHKYIHPANGRWWWQSKPSEGGEGGNGGEGGEGGATGEKTELQKAKDLLEQKTKAVKANEEEITAMEKIKKEDQKPDHEANLKKLKGKTDALKAEKTAAQGEVDKLKPASS